MRVQLHLDWAFHTFESCDSEGFRSPLQGFYQGSNVTLNQNPKYDNDWTLGVPLETEDDQPLLVCPLSRNRKVPPIGAWMRSIMKQTKM
jgi:hypothetical protein